MLNPGTPTEPSVKMGALSKALLFSRVLLFATAVPSLMRLKLTRISALIEPGQEPRPVDPNLIEKIAAYVEIAIRRGKPLVRAGCLTRGLTRYYFFRRAGMDVSLYFGMGRIGEKNEFIGHCWLVKDGEPYLETQDPRPLYTVMTRISPKDSPNSSRTDAIGIGRLMNS